jgi:RNA 2',3'-cyclic 3'-phosphodiesterase
MKAQSPILVTDLPPRIRAFVAARLSPDTDRAIIAFIDALRAPGDGISWARHANLHLTLRFLGGAVDSRKIGPLVERLRPIAEQTAPFVVGARGIGAFPSLARPRVIWAGLESEELPRLAARVEAAVVDTGFEPERRRYTPHLTIGRIKSPKGWARIREKIEAAAERDFGDSRIESMGLYESQLAPTGATYREIARFDFAAGG